MSTVHVTDETLAVARQEATRRGVDVSEIVDEAVRRFVGGADLRRLLEEFRSQDALNPDALHDAEAQRIAAEELAEVRRSSGSTR